MKKIRVLLLKKMSVVGSACSSVSFRSGEVECFGVDFDKRDDASRHVSDQSRRHHLPVGKHHVQLAQSVKAVEGWTACPMMLIVQRVVDVLLTAATTLTMHR